MRNKVREDNAITFYWSHYDDKTELYTTVGNNISGGKRDDRVFKTLARDDLIQLWQKFFFDKNVFSTQNNFASKNILSEIK